MVSHFQWDEYKEREGGGWEGGGIGLYSIGGPNVVVYTKRKETTVTNNLYLNNLGTMCVISVCCVGGE